MLPANLSPIGERLLVSVQEAKEEVNSSGLIIPATADSNKNDLVGEVLAVGMGGKTKDGVTLPMTVKIGDKVLFPKAAAPEVSINGTKYFVIKESDIYGIMN